MKTTCPPSSDQLAALVLGALDRAAERQLRDHVAACPICAQRLRELTALAGELAAVPAPPADLTPSPDFHRDWVRRLPAANPSAPAAAPRRPAAKGTGVGATANWGEYWRQLTAGWRAGLGRGATSRRRPRAARSVGLPRAMSWWPVGPRGAGAGGGGPRRVWTAGTLWMAGVSRARGSGAGWRGRRWRRR